MVPALGMLYPFFPRGSRDITPCEKKRDTEYISPVTAMMK